MKRSPYKPTEKDEPVIKALVAARSALAGDSNDAEHDALQALVNALDERVEEID